MRSINDDIFVSYADFDGGKSFYLLNWSYQTKCIRSDEQYTFSSDEEHTCIIILDTYDLLYMDPSAPSSLTHTSDRDLMTIRHPEKSTHQPKTDTHP